MPLALLGRVGELVSIETGENGGRPLHLVA